MTSKMYIQKAEISKLNLPWYRSSKNDWKTVGAEWRIRTGY